MSCDCDISVPDTVRPVFPETDPGTYPTTNFLSFLGFRMNTYFDNGILGNYFGNAFRRDNVLYGLIDTFTGEAVTFTKITGVTDSDIDNVIIVKKGSEYFKRNFSGLINVKWFGAKGDGITNDRVAINNALSILQPGQSLYFPIGTYLTDATGLLLLNKTNVIIYADRATIKQTAVSTRTYLDISMGPTGFLLNNCNNVSIKGLIFNGNNKSNALALSECTSCLIDTCEVYNTNGPGQFITVAGYRNSFKNCIARNSAGTPGTGTGGIYVGNTNSLHYEHQPSLIGNQCYNNTQDGIVICAEKAIVKGNYSFNNYASGIVLAGANNTPVKNVEVFGNHSFGNGWYGIQSDIFNTYLDDSANWCRDVKISGNFCLTNGLGGIYALGVIRWSIDGNTCNDNTGSGIDVSHARTVNMTANTCMNTTTGTDRTQVSGIRIVTETIRNISFDLSEISVYANICKNNTSAGIFVANVSPYLISGIDVSDNTCIGNTEYGINISEDGDNTIFRAIASNNITISNGTADIKLRLLDVHYIGNIYVTQQNVTSIVVAPGATTIPVTRRTDYQVNNPDPTSITIFADGYENQVISIRNVASTSNTTIVNNPAHIVLKGGQDTILPPNSGYIAFKYQQGIWREVSRNFDAFSGKLSVGYGVLGNVLELGVDIVGANQRKTIKFLRGGYATPSTFNTDSDGDKIVLFTDANDGANFDSRIGVALGTFWIKSLTSDGNGNISFYTGSNNTTPMAKVTPVSLELNGRLIVPSTIASTSGNITINKPSGSVIVAAGQSSITVTNSMVAAISQVFLQVMGNDTTAKSARVTSRSAGLFVITLDATATADTVIEFFVIN